MKLLSIRWKLTLWYTAVLAAVLAAFSAAVYVFLRHELLQRVDEGLTEEVSDVLSEVRRANDSQGLHRWLDRRFAQHAGFDFQITAADGSLFFANERLAAQSLPLPATISSTAACRTATVPGGGRHRVVAVTAQGPSGPLTVQVSRTLDPLERELSELLFALLVTGPLALAAAVGGGYFLARRALSPVQKITQTANEITAERLDRRVPRGNSGDELGALAATLNGMIERLERSFLEMQRFAADAAHELRTPLAIIRTEAEIALRSPRSAQEYCRVLESTLEETVRLARIADRLLFLCRQDAGLDTAGREEVNAQALVAEAVGNMQWVAEAKEISLSLARNEDCQLLADPSQLLRVLYNLLDNAIKFTPAGGSIEVSSKHVDGRLVIRVTDSGFGIPQEHLPHVFDRFYHVDPARTAGGGAGLGLAICQSIVKSHGGSISVESQVGLGSVFGVSLPLVARSAPRPGAFEDR